MSNITKITLSIFAGCVAGTAVASGAIIGWKALRERKNKVNDEKSADSAPTKAKTSSPREELKNLSVVVAPEAPSDRVFHLYLRLVQAIADVEEGESGIPAEQLAELTVDVVHPFDLDPEVDIDTLIYMPSKIIADQHGQKGSFIHISNEDYNGRPVVVVQIDDLFFSMFMREEDVFVSSGPALDDASTMGYLGLILDALLDVSGV